MSNKCLQKKKKIVINVKINAKHGMARGVCIAYVFLLLFSCFSFFFFFFWKRAAPSERARPNDTFVELLYWYFFISFPLSVSFCLCLIVLSFFFHFLLLVVTRSKNVILKPHRLQRKPRKRVRRMRVCSGGPCAFAPFLPLYSCRGLCLGQIWGAFRRAV